MLDGQSTEMPPQISQKTLNSPHIRRIGWEMAKGQSEKDARSTVSEKLLEKRKEPFYAEERNRRIEETKKRIEAEQNSMIDPLTGLSNRKYLDNQLEQLFANANRHNHDLTMLMMDLDKFKNINDTYGHPIGDEFLITLADTLRRTFRKEDVIARYGGEEFCIILSETDSKTAEELVKRLHENYTNFQINNNKLIDKDNKKIKDFNTLSIGIASLKDADLSKNEVVTNHKELIVRADQALYVAKHLGRNQAVRYGTKQYLNYI